MKNSVVLSLVLTVACTFQYTDAFDMRLYRLLYGRSQLGNRLFQGSLLDRVPRQQRRLSLLPSSSGNSGQRNRQVILLNPQNIRSSLLTQPALRRVNQRQRRPQTLQGLLRQVTRSGVTGQGRVRNAARRVPQVVRVVPVQYTNPQPKQVLVQSGRSLLPQTATNILPQTATNMLPQTSGGLFPGDQSALSQNGGPLGGQLSARELMFLLGGERRNRRLMAGTIVQNDPRLPGVKGVVTQGDGTDGTVVTADGSVITVDGSDVSADPPPFF